MLNLLNHLCKIGIGPFSLTYLPMSAHRRNCQLKTNTNLDFLHLVEGSFTVGLEQIGQGTESKFYKPENKMLKRTKG